MIIVVIALQRIYHREDMHSDVPCTSISTFPSIFLLKQSSALCSVRKADLIALFNMI